MPWVVVLIALPHNVIQEWSQFKKFVLSDGILIVIPMKVIENLQESISMHSLWQGTKVEKVWGMSTKSLSYLRNLQSPLQYPKIEMPLFPLS